MELVRKISRRDLLYSRCEYDDDGHKDEEKTDDETRKRQN